MHALVILLSSKTSLKFTFKAWIQELLDFFYLSLSLLSTLGALKASRISPEMFISVVSSNNKLSIDVKYPDKQLFLTNSCKSLNDLQPPPRLCGRC